MVDSQQTSLGVRWGLVVLGLLAVVLVPFALVGPTFEAALESLVAEATSPLRLAGLGFGALALDVLLPVPSSVVTSILGAKLGFVPGLLVGATGTTVGQVAGFLVARRLGRGGLVRVLGEAEVDRASQWLDGRSGTFAIAVSRPIPVISEAVILLAGATRADAGPLLLVAALANVGVAAVYSGIGAVSAALDNPGLLLVASLGLPLVFVGVTSLARR